jgi:ParB family transcriptional regulator, chromosome partitioning protein
VVKARASLGRGIDSLLGGGLGLDSITEDKQSKNSIHDIELSKIKPDLGQPRTNFTKETLEELAKSIEQHGVIQPIVVTKTEQNSYSIIAGERRWRASKLAGRKTIPAIIRSTTELEKLEIALLENVQREDLTPLEQALSVKKLHEEFSQSYDQIASRLGKASTTIVNMVRLLKLPSHVLKLLHEKKITEGHARSLLAVIDSPKILEVLLTSIVEKGWSVRQAENFVKASKNSNKVTPSSNFTDIPTNELEKKLGHPVRAKQKGKKVVLEISVDNRQKLKQLVDLLLARP